MEIVRQRKKRLLAWILTLVLCVGMWQGNVMASDMTGGTEKISYSDNIKVEGEYENTFSLSLTGAKLNESKEILVNSNVEEFIITATTNNYEHKLISWELSGSGEAGYLNETGTDNSIKRNLNNSWSSYNYGLYVQWGKIIDLRDEDGNELGVCYQESFEENAPAVTITLPENFSECNEGLFFGGWDGDISSGTIKGNIYTANFNGLGSIYYKEVLRKRFDSNIIPGSGTYSLNGNFDYILGSGSWYVGDDGYSYSGNQEFYLPTDGDYKFTRQEQ